MEKEKGHYGHDSDLYSDVAYFIGGAKCRIKMNFYCAFLHSLELLQFSCFASGRDYFS